MSKRRTAGDERRGVETIRATGGVMPQCAICGHSGRGPRSQLHLTHGISVWLCAAHGSDAFVRRRGGREFAERLGAVWTASGVSSARRVGALHAHVRRVRNAGALRLQPGSYSWPRLREEAERRFAAGECPNAVIADLRQSNRDGPAMVPSIRTMRRWFSEARWLVTSKPRSGQPRRRSYRIPSKYLRPGVGTLPQGVMQNPVFPWVHPWKDP